MNKIVLLTSLIVLALTACGGGGSSSLTTTTPPTSIAPSTSAPVVASQSDIENVLRDGLYTVTNGKGTSNFLPDKAITKQVMDFYSAERDDYYTFATTYAGSPSAATAPALQAAAYRLYKGGALPRIYTTRVYVALAQDRATANYTLTDDTPISSWNLAIDQADLSGQDVKTFLSTLSKYDNSVVISEAFPSGTVAYQLTFTAQENMLATIDRRLAFMSVPEDLFYMSFCGHKKDETMLALRFESNGVMEIHQLPSQGACLPPSQLSMATLIGGGSWTMDSHDG